MKVSWTPVVTTQSLVLIPASWKITESDDAFVKILRALPDYLLVEAA